ncbi:MAG: NUDIX hydrolase [Sumerlaeia bacterium]
MLYELQKQAGAIPFRIAADGELEFLLVTSSTTRQWIFPKGDIDPGRDAPAQAAQEAYEEAGVRGEILLPEVGEWEYMKWGTLHQVRTFLLRVEEVLDDWPERDDRERRWVDFRQVPLVQSRVEAQQIVGLAVGRAIHSVH